MRTKKENPKVNSRELLKMAFETMKMLKEKQVSVEEAKAQSNLIKQCNNVLRYELDRAIAIQKYENIDIRNIED